MCNPELILAAKPAVNRCQSQSTDFRGTFANFRGTFANYRGAFGQLPGYLWSFLANYRGAFGQLPGYLWQITGVPLVIFGQLPGYLWVLPGYLLPTSGVPLAKIRICHEIFRQRYPGNLSFTVVSLLFTHVLTMTTLLPYIGNPQATAWPGWNPVSFGVVSCTHVFYGTPCRGELRLAPFDSTEFQPCRVATLSGS